LLRTIFGNVSSGCPFLTGSSHWDSLYCERSVVIPSWNLDTLFLFCYTGTDDFTDKITLEIIRNTLLSYKLIVISSLDFMKKMVRITRSGQLSGTLHHSG